MFHLAAGVCLGIVAAVYVLNWLSGLAERRAERRERRAYRKMTRSYERDTRDAEYRARCDAEHQAYMAEKAMSRRH